MKPWKFSVFTLLIILTALICGCRSGRYYQAEAAERARCYLLENAKELTPEQIYFIKFNDPVLLTAPVLGQEGGGFVTRDEHMSSMQQQICVTWALPGASHFYLVFGVSDNRMFSWRPLRLIRRDFTGKIMPEDLAIRQSRGFAVNSLYRSLSVPDLNRIRFTFPEIRHTTFELNFDANGKLPANEIKEAKARTAGMVQYSLLWKNSDGSYTVFCGVSMPDMKRWGINFAGNISAKEVEDHTISIVRRTDQWYTPIVPYIPLVRESAVFEGGEDAVTVEELDREEDLEILKKEIEQKEREKAEQEKLVPVTHETGAMNASSEKKSENNTVSGGK